MDYGAILIGAGALTTAVGALVTGIYTGRNSRAKDDNAAGLEMERLQHDNDRAIELATRGRIEALVLDATEARRRFREAEDAHDKAMIALKHDRQRWWDAASYNFGLVSLMSHLLTNIFQVAEFDKDDVGLRLTISNGRSRIETLKIPISLDDTMRIMREQPE